MKKRDKLVITATVMASSVSIFLFAVVSLSHFLQKPAKTGPPLISKIDDATTGQMSAATLQTVEPQASTSSSASNQNKTASTTGVATQTKRPVNNTRVNTTLTPASTCKPGATTHCTVDLGNKNEPEHLLEHGVKSIYSDMKKTVSSLLPVL